MHTFVTRGLVINILTSRVTSNTKIAQSEQAISGFLESLATCQVSKTPQGKYIPAKNAPTLIIQILGHVHQSLPRLLPTKTTLQAIGAPLSPMLRHFKQVSLSQRSTVPVPATLSWGD